MFKEKWDQKEEKVIPEFKVDKVLQVVKVFKEDKEM